MPGNHRNKLLLAFHFYFSEKSRPCLPSDSCSKLMDNEQIACSLLLKAIASFSPLFWISGDVFSGFQSQSGFCLIQFFVEANVMYIPKIHLLCYMCRSLGGQQRMWSLPHIHQQRWDLAVIRTGNQRRRMRYYCASDPAFLLIY